MNETKPFYTHESDSKIMLIKDKAEVNNWTDDMEYINEELEYLLDIEDRMINSSELYQQMHTLRIENELKLRELDRYGSTMRNVLECDTVACDAFYLDKHEKNRNIYVEHLKRYRKIKTKVLSKILLNAKS